MKLVTHLEAIAAVNALPVRLLTLDFEPPVRRCIHLEERYGVIVRGELEFVGHMLGWTPLVIVPLLERHTAELLSTLIPWHFIDALHIGGCPRPRWQNLGERMSHIKHKVSPCWLIRQGRCRTVYTTRHSVLCSIRWRNLNKARLRKLQHVIFEKFKYLKMQKVRANSHSRHDASRTDAAMHPAWPTEQLYCR